MQRKPAHYLEMAKTLFGNPGMPDRELGELLGGFSQAYIAKAKGGNMSDGLALKLESLLKLTPGEVLLIARIHRENDPAVRAALEELARKLFSLMSEEEVQAPLILVAEGMRAALARRAEDWRKL